MTPFRFHPAVTRIADLRQAADDARLARAVRRSAARAAAVADARAFAERPAPSAPSSAACRPASPLEGAAR